MMKFRDNLKKTIKRLEENTELEEDVLYCYSVDNEYVYTTDSLEFFSKVIEEEMKKCAKNDGKAV